MRWGVAMDVPLTAGGVWRVANVGRSRPPLRTPRKQCTGCTKLAAPMALSTTSAHWWDRPAIGFDIEPEPGSALHSLGRGASVIW